MNFYMHFFILQCKIIDISGGGELHQYKGPEIQ